MVTDVLTVALGNETGFQWSSSDVDVVNRCRRRSRSDDPSSFDDPMLLLGCQAVDVNFLIDVLLAKTVKFRCDGGLDVILGVPTEVILVEVLKFNCLLDEVLLKLLFLIDVGGDLKYATVNRDVHEAFTKKFLKVLFMRDVDDIGCLWWRSTRWIVVLACWSMYCWRCLRYWRCLYLRRWSLEWRYWKW